MSDDLAFFLESKQQCEAAIHEAQAAIDQALEYIENQEDGPFTMWAALKEISERVDLLYTQVSLMNIQGRSIIEVTDKLRDQRDKALSQRDLLLILLGPAFTARARSKRKH